jgi:hypothetical protein
VLKIPSVEMFGLGIVLAVVPMQAQVLDGCHVFPANSVWNTRIDKAPVSRASAEFIASVVPTAALHPDWDNMSAGYGIPINQATGTTRMYYPMFANPGESDKGPYPIPAKPLVEGELKNVGCNRPTDGQDHHLLVVDSANCKLYEIYQASCTVVNGQQKWTGGSGAIWSLNSNTLRPAGWTSADAAGLPIAAGLIRYDEVASGHINHALRITFNHTYNSYVWPARHHAGLSNNSLPPMGMRVRLKASVNISKYPADLRVILTALKQYGAFVADNGSSGFLTGAPDTRWNMNDMLQIRSLHVSDLEFVDESMNQVNANSGQDSGLN